MGVIGRLDGVKISVAAADSGGVWDSGVAWFDDEGMVLNSGVAGIDIVVWFGKEFDDEVVVWDSGMVLEVDICDGEMGSEVIVVGEGDVGFDEGEVTGNLVKVLSASFFAARSLTAVRGTLGKTSSLNCTCLDTNIRPVVRSKQLYPLCCML